MGDVQRKIPLKHHCCETVFSKLFTPEYVHEIVLLPKANHFCIPHLIAQKYMGAFSATAVGFELHPALLNKTSLRGLRCLLCLRGS